jgi:hypothetical protein
MRPRPSTELGGQIAGALPRVGDRLFVEVDAEPARPAVQPQRAQQYLAAAAVGVEDPRPRGQRQRRQGGVDSGLGHRVGERQTSVGDPRGAGQARHTFRSSARAHSKLSVA